jgi:hypothetical protein
MTTAVPLTLNLAILIGLYELIAGIAGLTGRISWPALIHDFEEAPGVTFLSGAVGFMIGGTLILVHPYWNDLTSSLVSAVGWIVFAKGLLIMLAPMQLLKLSERLVVHQKLISCIAIGFGLFLIFLGVTGRISPAFI